MIFRLVAAVAIVAIALLTQPLMAVGQNLQLPSRFHGTAQWDCYPVPEGTVIEAVIAGDTYYASTSWALYGDDDYGIMIVPPEGTSYVDGTPVYFKIGDRNAMQVGMWEAGGNIELNLTDECVHETITTTYVSDGNTLVAFSSDGSNYGPLRPATETLNPGPWATIEGATWISSAYRVEGFGWDESWRKFERSFTVPDGALNVVAALDVMADDSYTVSLNGEQIGSGSGYSTVRTWPATPALGRNTITFVVRNAMLATGLIYRLTVSYETIPGLRPTLVPTPTAETAPTPTPAPSPEPTVAPGPVPTAEPAVAPTRQYVQGYEQSDAQGGGSNMSKAAGVAFFGIVDVFLIGLLIYLVWRFFVHPRVTA